MKKINKYTNYLLSILLSLLVFLVPVHAEDEEIPPDAETYTLTYPDGSTYTTNDYQEVQRLLKEENWKKMATGLTSDKNGNVELPAEWTTGTIKIVEAKVPAGYTQGDKQKIVKLEDKETTFVNPKVKPPVPNKKTPGSYVPKTGDQNIYVWLLALMASLIGLFVSVRRMKKS